MGRATTKLQALRRHAEAQNVGVKNAAVRW